MAWMDLDDIILSEVLQTRKKISQSVIYYGPG